MIAKGVVLGKSGGQVARLRSRQEFHRGGGQVAVAFGPAAVEMPAVKFREITAERTGETSAQIRERVVAARRRQQERFAGKRSVTCNARMGTRDLKAFCALDEATLELLKMAMNELKLSARAYDRILKVARTIDDLAGSDWLTSDHLSEAIQYRSLDRQLWA